MLNDSTKDAQIISWMKLMHPGLILFMVHSCFLKWVGHWFPTFSLTNHCSWCVAVFLLQVWGGSSKCAQHAWDNTYAGVSRPWFFISLSRVKWTGGCHTQKSWQEKENTLISCRLLLEFLLSFLTSGIYSWVRLWANWGMRLDLVSSECSNQHSDSTYGPGSKTWKG